MVLVLGVLGWFKVALILYLHMCGLMKPRRAHV